MWQARPVSIKLMGKRLLDVRISTRLRFLQDSLLVTSAAIDPTLGANLT